MIKGKKVFCSSLIFYNNFWKYFLHNVKIQIQSQYFFLKRFNHFLFEMDFWNEYIEDDNPYKDSIAILAYKNL